MSDSTTEVTADHLADVLAQGATLIDVRERDEYAEGHVPGAVLIPQGQLPHRLDELDKDAPVYVICAVGGRSAAMTDFLNGTGFTAYTVTGGTAGWARSGRELAAES